MKVKLKQEIADMNGVVGYRVVMKDESVWRCDKNGENWYKICLSTEELEKNLTTRVLRSKEV